MLTPWLQPQAWLCLDPPPGEGRGSSCGVADSTVRGSTQLALELCAGAAQSLVQVQHSTALVRFAAAGAKGSLGRD